MKTHQLLMNLCLMSLFFQPVWAQKKGLESINAHDLKTHMLFLASDELEGRDTGEPGMNIAARYLAVQAKRLGLKSADPEHGFFQPYIISERAYDQENSAVTIATEGMDPVVDRNPFYMLSGNSADRTLIEGEVVFAGYGIKDDENEYNDFAQIDIEGKIVLIMNRAPMNEEGTEILLDNNRYGGMMNFRSKLEYIVGQNPKAVLVVFDPKSGLQSLEDMNPGFASYLGRSRSLKMEESEEEAEWMQPRVALIHRSVADQVLMGSGRSLKELQLEIDRNFASRSFLVEGVHMKIELVMKTTDIKVSNVFGLIEGSDPVLKDEVVIYLAHYDHVGTDASGNVYNGADDNASGTVALIEIAEAFLKEKKAPKRSIGILWVSAEEIGLFGSQYFADHPLVPTEKTAAVINLDMVGRTKTQEDGESNRQGLTIVGGDTVKVIGGLQSKVLMEINEKTLTEMGLVGNYTYNDLNHPDRYFFRSDHISFARKDIPVLYYSTGTHKDYHRVTDDEELIDYDKFLKMTRFCYKTGFNVAQYDDPIEVDNPMSTW